MTENSTVKSLAKALSVLECFSVDKPELGISEISRMLGLQKSTVYNILSTFQRCGYLIKNPENSKYALGLKVLHLAYIVSSHHGLRDMFLPYLTRIARETKEVCYFGILDEREVLYIEAAYPSMQQQTRNILGERAPLYCTGLGKAMLAHLPPEEMEAVLAAPKRAFTGCTLTDAAALRQQMEEVRQNGYAVDNMEHEFGIRCVAVPVFSTSGQVIAAVSVSGPSPRFDPETIIRDARLIADILQPLQYQLN
jgi:DNA-binding IclR family transcriptional regulator